jgi:hypothetical protein
MKAYRAKWVAANPELKRAYSARYYAKNRDALRMLEAVRNAENPEPLNKSRMAWAKANPEKVEAAAKAAQEKKKAKVAAKRERLRTWLPKTENGQRHCPSCNKYKDPSEFGADGKATYCRPCGNRRARERSKKPETSEYRRKYMRAMSLRGYGLTLDDFEAMKDRQDCRCAICREAFGPNPRDVHVDHDHATGKVRALLCNLCNAGLGQFREEPTYLAAAIAYLRLHEENEEN